MSERLGPRLRVAQARVVASVLAGELASGLGSGLRQLRDHLETRDLSTNQFLGRPRARTVVHGALTGWKRAHVGLDAAGHLRFAGLTHSEPYLPDDDAVCPHARHAAPHRTCSCGFYAYRDRAAAESHPQGGEALLRVALSGAFVEYEQGFRTAHQRVEVVDLAGECCTRPAVAIECSGTHLSHSRLGRALTPRCGRCVRTLVRTGRGARLLALEELTSALLRDLPPGRVGEVVLAGGEPLTLAELDLLRRPLRARLRSRWGRHRSR